MEPPTASDALLPPPGGELASIPTGVRQRAALLVAGIAVACVGSLVAAGACSTAYPILLSHACIAFALGLRHAVDCDHLAAIDNVTRQLLNRGQMPISVGFWFALGHSTVVLMLTALLAGGYSWALHLTSGGESITEGISLVAGLISIALLGGIGLLNAQIASSLFRDWIALQSLSSAAQDQELREVAESSLRTALSAIPGVRRIFDHVDAPSKMYAVGFLFGLSFDSATQVGLIGLAAMTGSTGHVPPLMVMLFPVAFSCGMCLIDTTNGLLMLATYNWTRMQPIRKLFYNFVVTAMSAGIAIIICSMELLQIIAREAGLNGWFWQSVQDVDMATVGYSIIFAFVLVFAIAVFFGEGCPCCVRCHSGGGGGGGDATDLMLAA